MTLRIAILDAVEKEFRGVDPVSDTDKFLALLQPHGGDADFRAFHVAGNEFPRNLHEHDGFLLTGSPASVHDRKDWIARLAELVQEAAASGQRVLGCCFGHQLIATALGGEVGNNENGWMIGNYRVNIRAKQSWMEPGLDSTRLYHFNRERVMRAPEGATAYADSEAYPNFGYVIGENILAVQGHPEQTANSLRNFLQKTEPGMPADEVRLARRKIEDGMPDTDIWAGWMMKFFRTGNR